MNNSINHKFHHISRAEYQELLAVSRGDAVADYIIDNVSILDLINGGEISGPIVIKGRYIAGVGAEYTDAPALQRIDARGATAVPGRSRFRLVCPLCRTGKAKPILAGQRLRTRPGRLRC